MKKYVTHEHDTNRDFSNVVATMFNLKGMSPYIREYFCIRSCDNYYHKRIHKHVVALFRAYCT